MLSPKPFLSSPLIPSGLGGLAHLGGGLRTKDFSAIGDFGPKPDRSSLKPAPGKDMGGLGSRWPRGMWDNMDGKTKTPYSTAFYDTIMNSLLGHWRMVMASSDFVVTPVSYNRQYEENFRSQNERVSFEDLEKTRKKVRKWMADYEICKF